MRAMAASTASTAVTSPPRIAAASPVPSSSSYQPSARLPPMRRTLPSGRVRGAGRGSVAAGSVAEQERRPGRCRRTPRRTRPATRRRWPSGVPRSSVHRSSAGARTPGRPTSGDVAEFVAWAERGGCPEPADARPPHAPALPRLPRHPRLRAPPSPARRRPSASYLRYLRRQGVLDRDPGRSCARPRAPAGSRA